MELTTTNKKILTMALFVLSKHLRQNHPEAEKEIVETAEKIGLLHGYKMIGKLYEGFDKLFDMAKELGEPTIESNSGDPERDQATIGLIKKAMKSQDSPDLN